MTPIDNIKTARDIIKRDLLKSSKDYKEGLTACDNAIKELSEVKSQPCKYCTEKAWINRLSDFRTKLYQFIKNDELVTNFNGGTIRKKINYCPMCGRKLVAGQ